MTQKEMKSFFVITVTQQLTKHVMAVISKIDFLARINLGTAIGVWSLFKTRTKDASILNASSALTLTG